jgi:hypothetical protein
MKILLFGASGTAGGAVLRACLAATSTEKSIAATAMQNGVAPVVDEVRAIVRKPLGLTHAKLREFVHANYADYAPVAESRLMEMHAGEGLNGNSRSLVGSLARDDTSNRKERKSKRAGRMPFGCAQDRPALQNATAPRERGLLRRSCRRWEAWGRRGCRGSCRSGRGDGLRAQPWSAGRGGWTPRKSVVQPKRENGT